MEKREIFIFLFLIKKGSDLFNPYFIALENNEMGIEQV